MALRLIFKGFPTKKTRFLQKRFLFFLKSCGIIGSIPYDKRFSAIFMVVYVEYVFLQNFLLDGILLYLSLRTARAEISLKRLFFSSALGGAFALIFPLLSLKKPFDFLVKFLFVLPLCRVAFKGVKNKNERGRYARICLFLCIFSFCFAGGIFAFTSAYAFHANVALFTLSFAVIFAIFCVEFIKKRQKTSKIERFLYDCTVFSKTAEIRVTGFLDSGNLAQKNGLPVCFLSPELIFTLFEKDFFEKSAGQVCDEIAVTTLNGQKRYALYEGKIFINDNGKIMEKQAYFAPSVHMLRREYKLLLSSLLFEEKENV